MRTHSYRFCLGLLIAVLLTSCSTVGTLQFTERDIDSTANLVSNPSFNSYSSLPTDALKGWNVHLEPQGSALSPVIIDPQEATEGKTSLRIDASNRAVLILSEPFQVRRYGGYYLRTYLKSSSTELPNLQLRFIVFKENGKILNRFKSKIKPHSDWTLHSLSAGFIKPGARFGRMAILIPPFKDGSVWLDNAGCFEVHGFKID